MLGFSWELIGQFVCEGEPITDRQGRIFFFLIGSSQSAESLRTAVCLSSWLPIGRGNM